MFLANPLADSFGVVTVPLNPAVIHLEMWWKLNQSFIKKSSACSLLLPAFSRCISQDAQIYLLLPQFTLSTCVWVLGLSHLHLLPLHHSLHHDGVSRRHPVARESQFQPPCNQENGSWFGEIRTSSALRPYDRSGRAARAPLVNILYTESLDEELLQLLRGAFLLFPFTSLPLQALFTSKGSA